MAFEIQSLALRNPCVPKQETGGVSSQRTPRKNPLKLGRWVQHQKGKLSHWPEAPIPAARVRVLFPVIFLVLPLGPCY